MEFNLFMELICNPGFDPNFPDSVLGRLPSQMQNMNCMRFLVTSTPDTLIPV